MNMNGKKYILGGGISGLVFQFYNPEYAIITPDIGGMYANSYVVWLHDTAETRKLLTDLGYENVDTLHKRSYMGYYSQGWISEKLTPELNLQLIQKKMSNWNEPVDTSFVPKSTDLSTRGIKDVNYMNVLDVNPADIIKKLDEKHGTIINGKVTRISTETIEYVDGNGETQSVEYESIISTIPAPFFWKAFNVEKDFKHSPITNVITKVKPTKYFNDKFEMVYFGDSVPFTRISHLQDMYAFEFTGEITKEQFEELYPEYPVEKVVVIKQGRIHQEVNEPPQANITFAGRFGKWQFGITTEHVVKQAIDYKK